MLRDLRVKIRNRYSRISSCSSDEFFALTKQFFEFIKAQPLVMSLLSELVARNPKVIEEASVPNVEAVYGDTTEQAAAIGYTVWSKYAAQGMPDFYLGQIRMVRSISDTLSKYRDKFIDPLFDYFDEIIEDSNIVLSTLVRYKHKAEWYRRKEPQTLFDDNMSQGEKVLAKHMYEYLFDQGIPFNIEPQTASGRPDVVALEDSEHPFIGDAKIFDAADRGATYLKKGLYQVYQYCIDYNESVGYLIVFNVSNKQLRFEMPSSGGIPRFEYNHKTIFITVIDIHLHEDPASKRPIPQTVPVAAEDMVREVAEQNPAQSIS